MDTGFQTLVLNRIWQPVNVVGVERAFSLLSLDHAQVIYAEDESFRSLVQMRGLSFVGKQKLQEESGSFTQSINLLLYPVY